MEYDVMAGLGSGPSGFLQPAVPTSGIRTASRKVFPEFFVKPVRNEKKSNQEGIPHFDEVEFVILRIAGDSKSEVIKKVTDEVKGQWAQEYAQWKRSKTQSITGWPVEQMPGLSAGQIAVLKAINIHTVEHLADLTDGNLSSVGMGARDLRAKAQFLVKSAQDNAAGMKQAAELASARQEIALLREQMQDIQTRVSQVPVSAQPPLVVETEGGAPVAAAGPGPVPSPDPALIRRGPGRPPKSTT